MNQEAAQLRALGDEELRKQLEETRHELFNLRFRLSTRQMANTAELARVRRKVSRILTLLHEREGRAGRG